MRITTLSLLAAFTLLPGIAPAQQCDDIDECTANDMCSDGICTGSFHAGSCDDGDPCTINDHCVMDETGIGCRGEDPAPVGTECAGGCGSCQEFMGVPGFVVCIGDPGNSGNACDPGFENPCFEAKCSFLAGGFALCLPDVKVCPDTDGNRCNDACDFETGQCETANSVVCDPRCEACNPSTGACSPAHLGEACDDFDDCSTESSCHTIADIQRTFCLAGAATVPTPTSTAGTGPTPTRTIGTPGACVGDCDGSGSVAINELVLGVNISLGTAEISRCTSFDRNDSGNVEVNELVGAVNASLNGCV